MYSVKFELPMASFYKYICSFFARNFVVGFMLQCFYVPILLSRLFLRSKSVQKCSTAQSFTFPKFTSFKLGTLDLFFKIRFKNTSHSLMSTVLFSRKVGHTVYIRIVSSYPLLSALMDQIKLERVSQNY